MQKELQYQNEEGFSVFTSQYLKNRGTCCKSACLHCPFGYTVKKLGIQFKEVEENDFSKVDEIIFKSGQVSNDWKKYWPEHIRFILLKEKTAGVFLKNNLVLKHVYLLPHFQDQDLSRELIEAYFF